MSVFTAIYNLFIGPLELLFEIIFSITNKMIENPGFSIMILSLVMNFLVLPLYKKADAMQEEERLNQEKLKKWTTHIKKTFKGDERFMMLQTYYRQNHYKPSYALRGTVSLLLEIPFFIAAYNFLSGLQLLHGVSFGPIRDLGSPDGFLVIGKTAVNVLPILMTLINLVASAVYTKGFSLKSKIQLYGMAAIFLVLLYRSPSGLVFYWTLNNVFSLFKNIIYKVRSKLPAFDQKKNKKTACQTMITKKDTVTFLAGGLYLTVLTGVLIPSTVMNAAPEEFINTATRLNPLFYIQDSFFIAAGIFLIWSGIFYFISGEKGKKIMEFLICAFCGTAVVNYLFFGQGYGTMSADLKFEEPPVFVHKEELFNLLILAFFFLVFFLIWKKKKEMIRVLLFAVMVAGIGTSFVNMRHIYKEDAPKLAQLKDLNEEPPRITLSKEGKNVIVLMMDRAIGVYAPYIFNEKPEVKEQFEGFTYYPNTVSFGNCTNIGLPSVIGGYEYTPEELNKRENESLETKHNEALKVMPALFDQEGFDTTVCDPTYAGYDWIPDLSVYKDYPDISTYITMGQNEEFSKETMKRSRGTKSRNFFCYSMFRIVPSFVRPYIYDEGTYNKMNLSDVQEQRSLTKAVGIDKRFMRSYSVLDSLSSMTKIQKKHNTFLMMCNETMHAPAILQEPQYEPEEFVDNTQYDKEHKDRFELDGRKLKMEKPNQVMHYHVNMASYIKLGEWFDYLREQGVYDNTRIIITADHGYNLGQLKDMNFDKKKQVMHYNPLLMVKDFDSHEFTVDETFMTNADVPTLAVKDLIEDPVNLFTGNPLNNDRKNEELHIFTSHKWDVRENNGNQYIEGDWYTVHDNIFDLNNWKKCLP